VDRTDNNVIMVMKSKSMRLVGGKKLTNAYRFKSENLDRRNS